MSRFGGACAALIVFAIAAESHAQPMRKHVNYLASEACEGRDVGTAGHDRARDYIVRNLQEHGVLPAGADGWFVPVEVVRSVRVLIDGGMQIGNAVLARGPEYQIMPFSDGDLVAEDPILLGYGLMAPQVGWDDFGQHNLRNRTVVVFTGGPPDVVAQLPENQRYLLSAESKAAVALSRGATGIIFVNAPTQYGQQSGQKPDKPGELRPAFALKGIAAARVTRRAATRVFAGMELDLDAYQESLDAGRPLSVEIAFSIKAEIELDREIVRADNIVGKLAESASDGDPIVLGAHYDHLGHGEIASRTGAGSMHPGADDNASGIAVLLRTAEALRNHISDRPIYVVATTGEERGLRGARRLAQFFGSRGMQFGAYINVDMVGRLQGRELLAYVGESSEAWARALDGATRVGIQLGRNPLRESHSDHVAFADVGWDTLSLSSGISRDYHRPTDTADKIDWTGLRKVADLTTETLRLLSVPPE